MYHPILDEIFKLVANLDNLTLLDQLISKLKTFIRTYDFLEDQLLELLS